MRSYVGGASSGRLPSHVRREGVAKKSENTNKETGFWGEEEVRYRPRAGSGTLEQAGLVLEQARA